MASMPLATPTPTTTQTSTKADRETPHGDLYRPQTNIFLFHLGLQVCKLENIKNDFPYFAFDDFPDDMSL